MKRIMLTAWAAFAVATGAALPLCAAEVTHRWSFNGDFADSIGGADAVKCGTYVSLYGGRVHMGYGACSHGTGYVDLGTNMQVGWTDVCDTPYWETVEAVRDMGSRMYTIRANATP